jgi:hypothetical protein
MGVVESASAVVARPTPGASRESLDWLDFERSEGVQVSIDHQVHLRLCLEAWKATGCLGKLELHKLPSKAVQN